MGDYKFQVTGFEEGDGSFDVSVVIVDDPRYSNHVFQYQDVKISDAGNGDEMEVSYIMNVGYLGDRGAGTDEQQRMEDQLKEVSEKLLLQVLTTFANQPTMSEHI